MMIDYSYQAIAGFRLIVDKGALMVSGVMFGVEEGGEVQLLRVRKN